MEQGCEFWRWASVTFLENADCRKKEKKQNGADAITLEEKEGERLKR